MKSAIRWHERAVLGKLRQLRAYAALERSIVPVRGRDASRAMLPAGLSALLQYPPVDRAVWAGVPMRTKTMADPVDDGFVAVGEADVTRQELARKPLLAGYEPISRVLPETALATAGRRNDRARAGGTGGSHRTSVDRGGSGAMDPLGVVRRLTSASPVRVETKGAAAIAVMAASVGRSRISVLGPAQPPALLPAGMGTIVSGDAGGSTRAARPFEPARGIFRDGNRLPSANHAAALGVARAATVAVPAEAGRDAMRPGAYQAIVSWIPRTLASPASLEGPALQATSPNEGMGAYDVVPRKGAALLRSAAGIDPRNSSRAGGGSGGFDQPGNSDGPNRTGGNAGVQGDLAGSALGPQNGNGIVIALRGEVVLDGRKMGRMVAIGQTSAASLPGVAASAINLRAMPFFAGTSAPL